MPAFLMRRRSVSFALALSLFACATVAGCEFDDPCPGESEELNEGLCKNVATDAGTSDTGAGDASGALGTVCVDDSSCSADAPFCAKSPFDAEGLCTIRDCTVDPNDCPTGYICDDSALTFGAPTYCVAQ